MSDEPPKPVEEPAKVEAPKPPERLVINQRKAKTELVEQRGSTAQPRGYVPRRRTETQLEQCTSMNMVSGLRCMNKTGDSTQLCPPHLRASREKSEQRFVKCFNCPLVVRDDSQTPDIEATRRLNCTKAFWVSQGETKLLAKDVCFWDHQASLVPLDSAEDAMEEMKGLLADIRMRLTQNQRMLSARGIAVTEEHRKLMVLYSDLLKNYVDLRRGKQQFGRPGSEVAGIGGANKDFFKDLTNMGDGYEDGVILTRTEELKVERAKKVPTVDASYRPKAASPSEQQPSSTVERAPTAVDRVEPDKKISSDPEEA